MPIQTPSMPVPSILNPNSHPLPKPELPPSEPLPTRYAVLTVGAALLTLTVKFLAAWFTGSVGLLADAMESIVNLVTSIVLLIMLKIAKAPPDQEHPHGHDKAEYFANGVQGTLIVVAGLGILTAAIPRFKNPQMLEAGLIGLALSTLAGLVNLALASLLRRVGKAARSVALEGEASHLMSDVWTSAAVIIGVGLVFLTGWPWLDPTIALVLSGFILWTGFHLVHDSVEGLMDRSLPAHLQQKVESVLHHYCATQNITYHALRSRASGARIFISVHILVPGHWTVVQGHDLTNKIEAKISETLGGASVLTHLEPIEEPISFEDIEI